MAVPSLKFDFCDFFLTRLILQSVVNVYPNYPEDVVFQRVSAFIDHLLKVGPPDQFVIGKHW